MGWGCQASKAAARPEGGGGRGGECSEVLLCWKLGAGRGLVWHLPGSLSSALGISWEFSSGLEGSGTAASAVFSDH